MKWSRNDVAKFSLTYENVKGFKVDKVEGKDLWYSYPKGSGRWEFRARLVRGGATLSWTVHMNLEADNSDLFE